MVKDVRVRAKVKVKARARENIQEKGTTIRTRLDLRMKIDGQRTLGDFGKQSRELKLSVMSKRMMILRLPDWIEQLKSVMMDSTELPSSSKRVFDGSEQPAGTHEKLDQSTEEVLFAVGRRDDRPIVDSGSVVSTCPVDHATSVPTEKVHCSMNLEKCVG